MNVFLVLQEGTRTVIATPEKTGTILEGVTRDSLIIVARDLGFDVEERRPVIKVTLLVEFRLFLPPPIIRGFKTTEASMLVGRQF